MRILEWISTDLIIYFSLLFFTHNIFLSSLSTSNYIKMLCNIIASKSCSLATAALEKSLELAATSVINKEKCCFKRPCSLLVGSFDLSSLVEASQLVEDSIAFPSIEWSNDGDSEEDAEFIAPPAAKRRCSGLVRSRYIKCSLLSTLGVHLAKKNPSAALCADSKTNEDCRPVYYYPSMRRKTMSSLAA
jgi:hypothetical protein